MTVITVDPRTLLRSTLYDAGVKHPEQIILDLGIPSISDEGVEIERRDSHQRKHLLDPIAPILAAQCAWVSMACVYEKCDYAPDKDDPENIRAGMAFNSIITGAVVGVLSTLADRGLILIVVQGVHGE